MEIAGYVVAVLAFSDYDVASSVGLRMKAQEQEPGEPGLELEGQVSKMMQKGSAWEKV